MFFLKIKQMDRDGGPKKESEVKLYISREHKLRRNTKNNWKMARILLKKLVILQSQIN